MEYADIIVEATDRTGYSNLATRAAMYTAMAENDLNRRLRVGEMDAAIVITTDATGRAPLPIDFLEARSLRYATCEMKQVKLTELQMFTTGYAVQGGSVVTRYSATDLPLDYYAALPPLPEFGTNWLSETYPELYICAVMKQAFIARMDAEKTLAAESLLGAIIAQMQTADAQKRFVSLPWGATGP
jgi:hypothetical protein